MRPLLLSLAAAGLTLGLAGCAGMSALPAPAASAAPTPEALAAEAKGRKLAAFETSQRTLAESAETRGQWAQAAWAWEALQAVRPADEAVTARWQQALKAAESLSTLRAQQARLALQLNDLDGARDLFLKSLVAQPTQAEAIEGLRALERERVRKLQLAQPARVALPQRGRPMRAEIEHATLLAAQEDLEGAIALLLPLANARPADVAARRSLSDFYLRLAQAQRPTNPSEALATLQLSLQMDRRNARAAALLREWRKATPSPARRSP